MLGRSGFGVGLINLQTLSIAACSYHYSEDVNALLEACSSSNYAPIACTRLATCAHSSLKQPLLVNLCKIPFMWALAFASNALFLLFAVDLCIVLECIIAGVVNAQRVTQV